MQQQQPTNEQQPSGKQRNSNNRKNNGGRPNNSPSPANSAAQQAAAADLASIKKIQGIQCDVLELMDQVWAPRGALGAVIKPLLCLNVNDKLNHEFT